jgi:hypothetical protein
VTRDTLVGGGMTSPNPSPPVLDVLPNASNSSTLQY